MYFKKDEFEQLLVHTPRLFKEASEGSETSYYKIKDQFFIPSSKNFGLA